MAATTAATGTAVDPQMMLTLMSASRPSLRDAHDTIVFAVHCALLERAFKLVSLTDSKIEGKRSELKDLGAAAPGWNSSSDAYCFQYTHTKLGEATITLKAIRLDNTLIIHAVSSANDKNVHSMEVDVGEYVASGVSYDDYGKILKNASGLIALFDRNIRSKLLPDEASASSTTATVSAPNAGGVRDDPLRDPRFQPRQPPRHDPLADDRSGVYPTRPDFSGDLDPFGGGGGNLLGPGQFGPGGGLGIPGGRGGGRARFDPWGPGGGIGGEPDFDDVRPPRSMGPRGRGVGGPGFPGGGPGFGGGFGGGFL